MQLSEMRSAMKPSLGIRPSLEQTISPKMIAFYDLLAMTSAEVEQAIEQEVNLNPALELTVEGECPRCGATRTGTACGECGHDLTREYANGDISSLWAPADAYEGVAEEEPSDPTAALEAPTTLQEHLRWSLRASVRREDWPAASALVDNLDDGGYLQRSLDELAATEGLRLDSLERALAALQQLEPAGVGARDLRECLAVQLRHLAGLGEGNELAREIVWEHWDAFSKRQFDKIARQLDVSQVQVQAVADFVRDRLTPYPGRHWRAPWDRAKAAGAQSVRPDVAYERVMEGDQVRYEAHVLQSPWVWLRVSRVYSRLAVQIARDSRSLEPGERKHVLEQVAQAREFIDNLNRRRQTLKRIAEAVGRREVDFLERGLPYLKPLTRLQVARELRVHESTVGRALGGKWALLPTSDTVSFDVFFDAGYPAREALRQIVAGEDASQPLTDDELAARMAEMGLPIARRTVAKYRRELRVPPAHQRRRFA